MDSSLDVELEDLARASDRPTYNTAAVEQRTGIRPATFRAWERRYGFPRPRRLPGNQRLYSDRDISAIRWLQRRTDEGLSISHAVRFLQDRLREGPAPKPQPVSGRPPAALAADLVRALSTFDTHAAEGVLTEAFALFPLEAVCLRVIEPTLVEIGERWHRGEVSVATEHFATTFVRRKLDALLDAYETGRGRGRILTACAPGEWHEVGILMVSLFLVRDGFRVSYLGPNLTTEGLPDTLRRLQPDVLCVSATSEESGAHLAEFGRLVERLAEPRPKLAYGGQAFADPARREGVPGVYLGPDAESAVATIEGLLSGGGEPGNGGRAPAARAALR
jgi:MerR family transcriptional regulator, light-induced transcriptional regulator